MARRGSFNAQRHPWTPLLTPGACAGSYSIHQAVGRCDRSGLILNCSRFVRAVTRSPAASGLVSPGLLDGAIPTGIVLVCVSGWRQRPVPDPMRALPSMPSGTPSTLFDAAGGGRGEASAFVSGSASDRSPLQPAGCQSGSSPRAVGSSDDPCRAPGLPPGHAETIRPLAHPSVQTPVSPTR